MNFSDDIFNLPRKLTLLAMLLVVLQGAMLSGCATNSALMAKQVEQQTSDQQLIQQVMEALQITESRIAKAHADNVELYAPNEMDTAKSSLAEARRYYERFQADPGNVSKSISLFFSDTMGGKALELIAQADAALTRAEENKRQADAILAAANENFKWLKKFQAPVYFSSEYHDLERAQKNLIEYIADGRTDAARAGLPRLLQEQRALEVAAAQRFYLHTISQRIKRQEGYTLDRFAPISYSAALAALNEARATIAKNPRDEPTILAAKKDAEFSIDIAQAVALDMQKLIEMDRSDMERWLILLTTKLNTVGQTIGAADVRDHQLVQQLDLMVNAAEQSRTQAEQVATTAPEATPKADPVANTAEPTRDEQEISSRITQLEQTLAEQVKALSEQLNAMKAANKSAQTASE